MPDDAELLHRYAAARDEAAFTELVRRHLDGVYSAARRRLGGDAHLAEDAAQQVFVALARKAGALAGHPFLGAWLYTTTRNEAANIVRRERRWKAREQLAFAMTDRPSDSTDAAAVDWNRVAPVLDAAIDQLAEPDRVAIVMRYVERRGFAEIGAALQLSQDAARMRVERALDKLQALLARRGVTSTAAAVGTALASQAVATAPAGLAATATSAALGGAVAAGGTVASALTVLHLMSTSKFAVGAAAVIAGLALGTVGHRLRAQREATASLARIQAERATLAARGREAAGRAKAAEQKVAELKLAVATAEAKAAADAAAAKAAAAWDPVAEGRAIMRGHPEVAVALREASDAFVNVQFAEFFKARGLTPEQIAEFTLLWRGFFQLSFDLGGQKQRIFKADDALRRVDVGSRLRALLGPDGLQSYSEWLRTQGARNHGHEVASALCFTEVPLTGAQLNRLTEVIFAATPNTGLSGLAGDFINWEAIEDQAKEILSPEQLPTWKNVLNLARVNRDVNRANKAVRDLTPAK